MHTHHVLLQVPAQPGSLTTKRPQQQHLHLHQGPSRLGSLRTPQPSPSTTLHHKALQLLAAEVLWLLLLLLMAVDWMP